MKTVTIAIVFIILLAFPPRAFGRDAPDPKTWTGNVNLFLGTKILHEENWQPVDKPFEGGVLFDIKQQRWWFSLAIDLLYAAATEQVDIVDLGIGKYSASVESRIIELDLGIRKIWEVPKGFRPFVAGGFAIINGNIESEALGESVAEDNTGYGVWVNGGLYITLMKHLNLGLDARWSMAEIDLFDREARVGGWHFGVFAGFHW